MGNYVPNLCYVDGNVRRLQLRKKIGETYAERYGRVAAWAIVYKAKHFAVRQDGKWMIFPVSGPPSMPILTDLTEAAAAMWLMHRSAR